MDMFFVWLIFLLLIGEFLYILIFQKDEPERLRKAIKKETRFINKMIYFDKNQERKTHKK